MCVCVVVCELQVSPPGSLISGQCAFLMLPLFPRRMWVQPCPASLASTSRSCDCGGTRVLRAICGRVEAAGGKEGPQGLCLSVTEMGQPPPQALLQESPGPWVLSALCSLPVAALTPPAGQTPHYRALPRLFLAQGRPLQCWDSLDGRYPGRDSAVCGVALPPGVSWPGSRSASCPCLLP